MVASFGAARGAARAPSSLSSSFSSSSPSALPFRWLEVGVPSALLLGAGGWLLWRRRRRPLVTGPASSTTPPRSSWARDSSTSSRPSSRADAWNAPWSHRDGSSSDQLPSSPSFSSSSSAFTPSGFSFAAAELRRLQAEAEWLQLQHQRASKAADDWQLRQRQRRGAYSRWSQHRDRQREEREEEEQHKQQQQQQEEDEARQRQRRAGGAEDDEPSRSGSSYFDWHSADPSASSHSSSAQPSAPAQLLHAGRVLGLPSPPSSSQSSSSRSSPLSPSPPSLSSLLRAWSVLHVKAAFKRAALQTHPDMPNGDARHFQAVAAAYDQLMNAHTHHTRSSSAPHAHSARHAH